ncbi:MAG: DoxX family protein, partial [Tannerella sp.]|nr:DoxX family protein [Tannerella sp.]
MKQKHTSSSYGKTAVTLLRIAIGWHFLYEGVAKIAVGGWSSQSYLANTSGFLSPFYHWIASSPAIGVVDWLNIAGLTLVGLALFLGVLVRFSAATGALLLALYYFAYPPFGLSLLSVPRESHLFVVDPLLLEALALLFLALHRDTGYGVDRLSGFLRRKSLPDATEASGGRREAIKNLASLPLLGLMGWGAWNNGRRYGVDVMSGATVQINRQDMSELKGRLPFGRIGRHEISRLVLGGNLIGGWAHARDLLYADTLFKAYNTERKIYETLMLAEAAGINAVNIGFPSNPVLQKYRKATGSRLKVITQIAADVEDESTLFDNMYEAIDFGVDIIQIQGNWCDWMVRDRHVDRIGRLLDRIRQEGFTAGLGAHTVDSLIACRDAGIVPDYYMKTMHH